MRADTQAPTIRLSDYRPPAFLADGVELTFALAPDGDAGEGQGRLPPQPGGRRPTPTSASTAAA